MTEEMPQDSVNDCRVETWGAVKKLNVSRTIIAHSLGFKTGPQVLKWAVENHQHDLAVRFTNPVTYGNLLEDLMKDFNWLYARGDDEEQRNRADAIRELLVKMCKSSRAKRAIEVFYKYAPEGYSFRADNFVAAQNIPEGEEFSKATGTLKYRRIRTSALAYYHLDTARIYGVDDCGSMADVLPGTLVRVDLEIASELFDPFCGLSPEEFEDY